MGPQASDYPVIQIIHSATGSYAATIVLGTVLVVLLFFSTVTTIASASRQIWAFSRDQVSKGDTTGAQRMLIDALGISFLDVDPPGKTSVGHSFERCEYSDAASIHMDILTELSQLLLCMGISLLLSAINFGSDTAFNAVLSVSNAALLFSYIVSIGCVRLKRLRGEPLLPRRWSLGKWGGLINDITLAFLVVSFVFSFFPEYPSVGDPAWVADFNWAIVIFAATCLLALIYYISGGGQKYVAPVSLVKQD